MTHPCIVYRRSPGSHEHADNKLYHYTQQYELTLISRDPDTNTARMQLLALSMCKHDVSFAAENLNHDVFSIYF